MLKKFFLLKFIFLLFNTSVFCTVEYYDTSFGANATGIVQPILGRSSRINDVTIGSDGKIIAVGSCIINTTQYLFIAKYNNDGTLDSSFANNGTIVTLIGTNPTANAVTVDLNNNIYVTGTTQVSSVNNIFVVKYLANGSIDLNFAVGGKLTKLIGTTVVGNAITLDANGKVLIAGTAVVSGKPNLAIYRLNSNGTADNTFGTNGVKTLVASNGYNANAIKIDPNAKIVVGGAALISTGSNFLIARLKIDGNVDTTFGVNGVTTTAISGSTHSVVKSVAFDSLGKIFCGGYSGSATSSNFTIARYNVNGSLDTSFGTNVNGIQITNIGSSSQINSIIIRADQKITVGGLSENLIARARYLNNGSLDLTFGNNGILTTSISDSAQINSIAIQTNERVVAGGFSNDSTTNNNQALLIRYNKNNTDFVNITSFANNEIINTKVPNIFGTSSIANGQVEILINGNVFKTVSTDNNGNWDAGITNILQPGLNVVQANLFQGSTSIVSEKLNFTVLDAFAEDSVSAYNSDAQIAISTLYSSLPFNNLVKLGTWSYNNNIFTCNQAGIYLIEYSGSAGTSGNIPNNVLSIDCAMNISLNNIEYLGSESNAGLELNVNSNKTLSRGFIKQLYKGDKIALNLAVNIITDGPATGFNAGLLLDPNSIGVQPTYSLTITRIG